MESHVKIYFEIPSSDSDEIEVETIWAVPYKKGFKLDNIPFYATGVAIGDIVSAKKIDSYLYYHDLLESSGHSTVRIWFIDEKEVQSVRNTLKSMGCDTELSDRPCLVAVDIPPSIPYENIRSYLDDGEADGRWDYQEACLGFL